MFAWQTPPFLFGRKACRIPPGIIMSNARSHPRYCFTSLLADAFSVFRLGVAVAILWLGWRFGSDALPAAIILATLGWMSDGIDGILARHSPCRTYLGGLDYPTDVALTWSEFIFAALAGFISPMFLGGYTIVAIVLTLWVRRKAVLVLFMRGIDVIVLYFALIYAPLYLLPLLAWLILLGVIHRQRVRSDIPRWFNEMADILHLRQRS